MTFWPIPALRDEWLALRHKYIGGSEIASLYPPEYRASWHLSPFALYHHKRGTAPADDDLSGNERVQAGIFLEEGIAKLAAWKRGWKDVRKGMFAVNNHLYGSASTLDFIIDTPGPEEVALGFTGPGVLQIKMADYGVFKEKWSDDDAPWPYVLQVQKEMFDADYDWGVIACLVGGNRVHIYPYSRDRELEADMAQRITDFWRDVKEEREPSIDGDASTTAALLKLFPTVEEQTVDLSGLADARAAAEQYRRGKALESQGKALKDEAKNTLLHMMGPAKYADLGEGARVKLKENKGSKGKVIDKGMIGMIFGARKPSKSVEIDIPGDDADASED